MEPLASSKAVAEAIGITENALAHMRVEGDGPEFIIVGARTVKYDWNAVRAWLDTRTYKSTAEYSKTDAA